MIENNKFLNWSQYKELEIQNPSIILPRLTKEGSISFAYGNSVTTWNFINNHKKTIKQYGHSQITSLLNFNNNHVIIGNKKGDFYLNNKNFNKSIFSCTNNDDESVLYKIIPLSENNKFLLFFKNHLNSISNIYYCSLSDSTNSVIKEIKSDNNSKNHILLVDNLNLIEYSELNNEIVAKYFDLETQSYNRSISKKIKGGISHITSYESGNLVCSITNENTISIWNIKDDSMKSVPIDKKLSSKNIKDIKIIDEDSIVITSSNDESNDNHFSIYQISLGLWKHLDDGNHKDIISLSDQSYLISKSLRSGQSSIEILSKENFTSIFKYESLDISKILSLNTNHYGFIFAQFESRLVIFKPDYLSNNHDSSDIISKIKFAIKQCDSYQTRKILDTFIKNSPEMEGQDDTDIDINIGKQIYELLKQSPLISEMNRVSLYLFRRTGDHQYIDKDRKCKSRLILGDGDFSYTLALIEKHRLTHPKLIQSLVATEYSNNPFNFEPVMQRMEQLDSMGVKTILGVNAVDISRLVRGGRVKRIQWNCPYFFVGNRSDFGNNILVRFFKSASSIQHEGDRIHVTLIAPPTEKVYRQLENPIARASWKSNYRLIRKRRLRNCRYPGYQHHYTKLHMKYPGNYKYEFVFEKLNPLDIDTRVVDPNDHNSEMEEMLKLRDTSKKNYNILYGTSSMYFEDTNTDVAYSDYHFECSTDEDSSDYYEDSDGEDEECDDDFYKIKNHGYHQ